MSRAKALIEAMGAPAAPPVRQPGTKPAAPARPAPAKPSTNPFRRDRVRPGEEPRPKACMAESKGLKQPAQGGKAPHAFSKAKAAISSKSSGTGASGLTAKKAFKK